MKTSMTLLFALFVSSTSFALQITGTLQTNSSEDTVAIVGDYLYKGTSSRCMSTTLTDDGWKTYPYEVRRLFVLPGSKINRTIPTEIKVSGKLGIGSCVLTRVAFGRMAVIKKQVLKNITKPEHGGKKIDEITYELKRSMSGLTVEESANGNNRLSCSFRPGDLKAECNADSVSYDAQGKMNLDITVQ